MKVIVYLHGDFWAPVLHYFRAAEGEAQESYEHYSLKITGLERQQHPHGNPECLKEKERGGDQSI